MSLTIECEECNFEGKVSPAKAGKTIPCPSCSEPIEVPSGKAVRKAPKPRTNGTTGRAKTDNSSIPLIALGGATVLLVGILAMYMIKKAQMEEEFGPGILDGDPVVDSEPNTTIPSDDASAETTTQPPVKESAAETTSPAGSDIAQQPTTTKTPDDYILPDISAVDPRMLLLAGLDEVFLDITGIPEDTRGAVQNAVNAKIKSALAKCRLGCSEDEDKPKIMVDLDLQKVGGLQRLGMAAQLQSEMSGVPVTIWEHKAALVPIDQKALNGSIALPGLDREVGAFFNSLRDKITTARTTINSIKENQRRRQEAKDKENAAAAQD